MILGADGTGNASLSVTGNLINDGTIQLQSQNQGYSCQVVLSSGTLVTAPDGTILVNSGSGGYRGISGNLTNQGTISLNSAQLEVPSSFNFTQTTGSVSGSGSLYVDGGNVDWTGGNISSVFYGANVIINIASSYTSASTIELLGTGNILDQNLSPSVTLWVLGVDGFGNATLTAANGAVDDGLILLKSQNQGYTCALNAGSGLTISSDGTVQAAAGSGGPRPISGTLINQGSILASGYSLSFSGTLEMDGGSAPGPLYLYNTDIEAIHAPASPTTLYIMGTGNTLTTNITPNLTLWLLGADGGGNGNATLTSPNGFTNDGTIQLQSQNHGYSCQVVLSSGTLVNAPDGTILVNNGSGGYRGISGNLTNQGTISLNSAQLEVPSSFNFTQTTGSVSGSGSLYVDGGNVDWTGGNISSVFLWCQRRYQHRLLIHQYQHDRTPRHRKHPRSKSLAFRHAMGPRR